MNFSNVIVKTPGKSYTQGLTTSSLGTPDYEKTLKQHAEYVDALQQCGVKVTMLPLSEDFPDATFVEDTAVLTEEFAVITHPGATSRNGEKDLMIPVIRGFYQTIHYIGSPGTLDGGDVLQAEDQFYIGISDRTNEAGARQFKAIVEQFDYQAIIVPLKAFFHLKTGIAYLGDNRMVVAGEFIDRPDFASYDKLIISDREEYAANCIRINDTVIIPDGYPEARHKIEAAGYPTIALDMSEFQKQDGGLSCLSLRF
ncbi:dimethylarginine dimethylaminohydrolase family protein [Lentibacillus sp. CBA3610]|uniref:dimethylarginine dimethylaminohydrolase family protein n=1 Tax=Lentibacillus sp. CBA3610 TaxID=2518176 RepID=UPI001595CC6E|nr:arginine deiminase family protein [Lentibacillus sp. CBA3610]QKY70172.1 N(G),N(G)-dimethylarginine dimethylaminohydrolase [Lentibacillus sp. CBA3610]